MKLNRQYILTAGVAGSRWGRVEGILEGGSTLTDQSAWWTPQRDHPDCLTGHDNAFWGPFNRLGECFDQLKLLGHDRFLAEMEAEFDPTNPGYFRFIRCHWFTRQLEWLQEHCPDMWILLMFREPEMCKRWWYESGGWDISYPSYEWYGSSAVLNREIDVETKYMYKFVRDNNLEFDFNVSQIDKWLKKHLPDVADPSKFLKYTQELDETIWPILYKGKNHVKDTSR